MLKAFLEPKNISEEQLLNWEQRECPWSADESTLVSDPDRLASDVREILGLDRYYEVIEKLIKLWSLMIINNKWLWINMD